MASGLVVLAARALAHPGTADAKAAVPAVHTGLGLQVSTNQAMPDTFIGVTRDSTGDPGSIEVVSTADGHVVRSLARAWTVYAMDGLSGSGTASVYFDRLTPSGKVELAVVSVAGGPVTDLVEGVDPALSSDGRYLAYVPAGLNPAVGILDLQTGGRRTIDLTAEFAGYEFAWPKSLAWLDHDTRLAVLGYKGGATPVLCPPTVDCAGAPFTAYASRLVVLTLTSASTTLSSVITSQPNEMWSFLAAANHGHDVVVFDVTDNGSGQARSTRFLEAPVGSDQWRTLATPAAVSPLSLDSAGTHLLYQDGATLKVGTFSNGSLTDMRTIPGVFATASW